MARWMNLLEHELARSGGPERLGAHYGDALHLDELLTLADKARALASRGVQLSSREREKWLCEREAVLAHGDRLAARSPSEVSVLLRDELTRARSDWKYARAAVLQVC